MLTDRSQGGCQYRDLVTGLTTGRGNNVIFSLRHRVQNGSGAHPASYPSHGNRGLLPRR